MSTSPTPTGWTRNQLTHQMRQAGWKRQPGPAAVYVHPNGGRVHLDGYIAGMGLVWRFYAEREEVPMQGFATPQES